MNITVYCGSRPGREARHSMVAAQLGRWIAQQGYTLVYGGGHIGLMGEVADGALSCGGKVLGVIPDFMVEKELAHKGLTNLEVVETMSQRKARMVELGDVFVALPGGVGSLEEIAEVISWARLGIHSGECVFFNVAGFYDDIMSQLEKMVADEFYQAEDFDRIHFVSTMEELAEICIEHDRR